MGVVRRDVFQAIADPTRRAILSLLAVQTLTMTSIADHFKVSRPAISKHVKILEECGLVSITQQGRERYCEASMNKLDEVSDWVERYRKMWDERLDRLEEYLKELQSKEKEHGNKI
jgi:DNA-binding transcriptional ArsR family regulator